MAMKEFISIFKPKVARQLLKMGNQIVDIKADKNNTDRTVFIFRNTKKLTEDLTLILKN